MKRISILFCVIVVLLSGMQSCEVETNMSGRNYMNLKHLTYDLCDQSMVSVSKALTVCAYLDSIKNDPVVLKDNFDIEGGDGKYISSRYNMTVQTRNVDLDVPGAEWRVSMDGSMVIDITCLGNGEWDVKYQYSQGEGSALMYGLSYGERSVSYSMDMYGKYQDKGRVGCASEVKGMDVICSKIWIYVDYDFMTYQGTYSLEVSRDAMLVDRTRLKFRHHQSEPEFEWDQVS